MAAPLDPVERVRRLAALVERGEASHMTVIADDLVINVSALSTFKVSEIEVHGSLEQAYANAMAELNDVDERAAAAASWRARSKTTEHARIAFNAERGETIKWSAFKTLLQRAADRGLDGSTPVPIPLGQVVKGLSTMSALNPQTGEWEEKVKWTKTKSEPSTAADAVQAFTEALKKIPPARPMTNQVKNRSSALLNTLIVTDLHIGQASDPEEGGAVWDCAEASRVLIGCADICLRGAPPAKTLLIGVLGDYLDYEGPINQTFTSQHASPSKDGFHRMVDTATEIGSHLVTRGLETHEEVVLAVVDGNHDPASAIWFRRAFEMFYRNEPRVKVLFGNTRGAPHCAYQHGGVMLGFSHQHLLKSDKLPGMFSDEYAPMWGQTKHREAHCGHLHNEKVETHQGMTVYQHPTLAARSRHVSRHSWNSPRSIQLTTYHEVTGRGYQVRATPEMLEAS